MRNISPAPIVAGFTAAAVVLLAGCSGGSSSNSLPAGVTSGSNSPLGASRSTLALRRAAQRADKTGVAPRFYAKLKLGTSSPHFPPANSALKEVAVADGGAADVVLLSGSYKYVSSLTGAGSVDGDWVDLSGNVYVADYADDIVDEYAKGSSSITATYTAGLEDPIDMTTDPKGNVYVADYEADSVTEFAQGVNAVVNQCTVDGGVEGVAVDYKGDVFVSYNSNSTGEGALAEFKGGLAGCSATALAPTLTFAGGLALATNGDLVAADQEAGVDIIPPPYTSISKTINTGASDYFHIALSKYDHLLFIADPGNADAQVVNYKTGAVELTLGSAQGISDPFGVAAYQISK